MASSVPQKKGVSSISKKKKKVQPILSSQSLFMSIQNSERICGNMADMQVLAFSGSLAMTK